MNSEQMKEHLEQDLLKMKADLVSDARQELAHVTDPAQCGEVVRRHFNGLMVTLYLLILAAMFGAAWLIWAHAHG